MALPTRRSRRGLRGYDPFRELEDLRRDLEAVFRPLTGRYLKPGDGGVWSPSVDVYESDGELVLEADLPGTRREDVKVSVEEDTLVIEGERSREKEIDEESFYRREASYGRFVRRIGLPAGVSSDDIRATFRDGVLEVRMPAPEPAAAEPSREIPVEGE